MENDLCIKELDWKFDHQRKELDIYDHISDTIVMILIFKKINSVLVLLGNVNANLYFLGEALYICKMLKKRKKNVKFPWVVSQPLPLWGCVKH